MSLFHELNEAYKQTILLITHDQNIAKNSKRTIIIEDGQLKEDNER